MHKRKSSSLPFGTSTSLQHPQDATAIFGIFISIVVGVYKSTTKCATRSPDCFTLNLIFCISILFCVFVAGSTEPDNNRFHLLVCCDADDAILFHFEKAISFLLRQR